MFSILFGLACLAGLFHLNRGYLAGHRGACGHGAHHPHHHHDRSVGRGPRFVKRELERTLRALRVTPEQASTIRSAFDELRLELEGAKHAIAGQRRELAEALRDESVHHERVEVIFTAQRDALEGAQGALKRALDQVHAVLDPVQRQRLAERLAGRRGVPFGPYR